MRYYDFKKLINESFGQQIKEQQDLFEVKMTYTNLQKLVKDIDARAGLEFEMIVPDIKADNEDAEMEPDYDYDEGTYSINQIVDFFHDGDYNGRGEVNRLENALLEDFQEWANESFDARWSADAEEAVYRYLIDDVDPSDIADILGIELDSDSDGFTKQQMADAAEKVVSETIQPYYNDAKEQARDEYMEELDQTEWLTEAGLDYMSNISNSYDITWPHWSYPETEDDADIDEIANSFSAAVGREVNTSQTYGSGRREPNKYVIEPDGSLMPGRDEDEGLEFVSPPLTIPEMLDDLKKVMAWAKDKGCYTNRSTGLHMNVSVPEYNMNNLDYVKLAILLGDKYILEQFGRATNTYCRSALEKVVEKADNISTPDMKNILENMKSGLNKLASRVIQSPNVSKYTSINPQENRVEFRSPGNDWLNDSTEKLTETLLRFVVVLDAAMDPEKYKEEYYKKFYKLMDRSLKNEYGEMTDEFAKYMAYLEKYDKGSEGKQEALPKDFQRALIDFRKSAVDQLKKQNLRTKIRKGETSGERYNWHIQYGNRGVQVIAQNEEEALQSAANVFGVSTNNLGNAEVKLLGKYEPPTGDWYAIQKLRAIGGNQTVHRLQAADRSAAEKMANQYMKDRQWDPLDYVVVKEQPKIELPPPFLNDRPSNPQGNIYIASRENPEVPLYRFMAADGNDVRTVLNQWREQYGSNYIYRIDHLQLQGQPRQTQTTEPIGRVRADGPSRPAWQAPDSETAPSTDVPQGQEVIERLLRLTNQAADANYEIVRRSDYQPVFLFIANTPQDASRMLERYLEVIGLDQDSEEFGFRERAIPGSTLDLQRRRVAQSARAAVQSTSGNRLWQIIDSADGEVAYEFYLRRENNQQDANEVGLRWVRNNGNPNTTYSVREQPQETGTVRPQNQIGPTFNAPEDNPDANWAIVDGNDLPVFYFTRNTRQEAEAVFRDWQNAAPARTRNMFRLEPLQTSGSQPESIRWRILVGGEEVHRFWNRSNQGEANAVARTWIQDQIRRGLLSIEQGAEVEVVPVQSNQ